MSAPVGGDGSGYASADPDNPYFLMALHPQLIVQFIYVIALINHWSKS